MLLSSCSFVQFLLISHGLPPLVLIIIILTRPSTAPAPYAPFHRRRRCVSVMPTGDSPTPLRQAPPDTLPFELKDEADFDRIVTPDGLVSVCGFGSLLSSSCGSEEVFYQRYGQYGINKIWMDDILPCRIYLCNCVLAAKNLSDMAYDNFLDHTFLSDRKTTIRQYLASSGSGIMEEEPPEELKHRCGG